MAKCMSGLQNQTVEQHKQTSTDPTLTVRLYASIETESASDTDLYTSLKSQN